MERRERRDPLALEREHHQSRSTRDRALGVLQVEVEGRLTVRARGHEPEAIELPARGQRRQKLGDRALALVAERLRRHGEPGIVGQQLDDPLDVAGLKGVSKQPHELPLIVAGVGVSMAIPAGQNSVVGSVADDAIGKAAGANSMMRELGGVFGIAVTVAVFAGAGSYASAEAFSDGFAPAIGLAAALSLAGAAAGAALPRRSAPTRSVPARAVPALETEGSC